ncbi:Type III secretion system lipoprotein chaperone (YscW) [Ectothiorhodospira mobilis]|uniref:Type III secretion system lipoprotein chaperone (YscW) n=1 Tax=Ectothiorhodospira mobilis TaxID=195064 RepID=A0A1I4PMM4_ECTMO|nr:META domain-containing protein [Ectothiorhodospira mobilis]SFM28723.1 Type III secretion system lipoprotein chaperone (YscW) [Ectothiorhodospira mobilis]
MIPLPRPAPAIFLALLALLPACAPMEKREVTGALTYRPRIALPPEAEVEVSAQGALGTRLGEYRKATGGAQVPLPFTLSFPPGVSGTLKAASGARYVAEGGEDTLFWSKRDAAMLRLQGRHLPECTRADRPPPYRASGNEPGWHVDVGAQRVQVVTDYGARTLGPLATTMMACPQALMDQERRVLQALEAVRRFDRDATGALRLMGESGDTPLLTARRP